VVVIVSGYPPPFSQPRVTINNNYYGGSSPLIGAGYDQDTRGYDLDQVPIKRAAPPDSGESRKPAAEEPSPSKPLPGVDVSKSKPPVRPGDPPVEPRRAPDLPQPPEPLADPRDESARLLELGTGAFQAGAYGLAAQRFRQATQVMPALARAHFLLAQAEFALGKYRDAVDTIHAGMKIDKQWPRTSLQPRLELYKGRDAEYGDHMKHLTDAAAANPNNATLLFLVAHQLWFDGQRKDALALFQRARPLAEAADRPYFDAFLAAGGPGAIAKAS
jgi:tetratricopeptide (TPR) repeat protein